MDVLINLDAVLISYPYPSEGKQNENHSHKN